MASNDLVAFVDQGTFSLNFPKITLCNGDVYNYSADELTLEDGGGNDVLSLPLSYDSDSINYDGDHFLAAPQVTVLNAKIIDRKT